jgi:hypothetical protein
MLRVSLGPLSVHCEGPILIEIKQVLLKGLCDQLLWSVQGTDRE